MTQFLRRPTVCTRYGISRSTLYSWIQQGLFPAPTKLGWPLTALEQWERTRPSTRKDG
jgi:predicted DNA-binding transcriptional regulator AlpA